MVSGFRRQRNDFVTAATGLKIDTYFSASKLTWLVRNHPDIATKLENGEALIGTIDTYLIYRLTGGKVFATDYTNASRTLLFDITTLRWSEDFNRAAAFLDLRGRQTGWTGDRREFLGRNGSAEQPEALCSDRPLSGQVGAGLDPCGALQTEIALALGSSVTVDVVLGQANSSDEAIALATRYRDVDPDKVLNEVTQFWDGANQSPTGAVASPGNWSARILTNLAR